MSHIFFSPVIAYCISSLSDFKVRSIGCIKQKPHVYKLYTKRTKVAVTTKADNKSIDINSNENLINISMSQDVDLFVMAKISDDSRNSRMRIYLITRDEHQLMINNNHVKLLSMGNI